MRLMDHMAIELFKATEEFRKNPQANAVYLQTLVKAHAAQVRSAVHDKENARKEGRFIATPIFDADITDENITFNQVK